MQLLAPQMTTPFQTIPARRHGSSLRLHPSFTTPPSPPNSEGVWWRLKDEAINYDQCLSRVGVQEEVVREGDPVPKPGVISRLEQGEDPCVPEPHAFDGRKIFDANSGYPLAQCVENILLTKQSFCESGEDVPKDKLYDWLAAGKWLGLQETLSQKEGIHTEAEALGTP
ncbi:hypothetical protein JRQ81_003508 [Phrynocephalus forsythii]|uniref:Uncharacterized protein n=1 Tax=Phrynocephalus forsythii TaxID=171643 RepID=A0A9Q0XKM4_9SAUR|nr:hypothetical protein JRQ81_003508 [Phrynocephalus forsythii]